MRPIITVEFNAKNADLAFKEESVAIHSPEELLRFVAPGGGCESIPSEVEEIKMVFLPPSHLNTANPIADRVATLELGMVFFTGPLAEIVQTAEQIIDKAGRGELSRSFLSALGVSD